MRSTMRITLGSSANLLRRQILYIAVSAVAGAIFWAIGERINPLTVLLYGLAIGNLIVSSTERLHGLYSQRRFPYNWLLFLFVLLVLLIPIYVTSSVFVWLLAPPTSQTLGHLLRTGWKFPILITFVSSVLVFLYQTTKEKLERRNAELQQSVDIGTAQLEIQDQELERAGRSNNRYFPRRFRSCLDSRSLEHGARRGW